MYKMNPNEQLKDVKSRMAKLGICTNVDVQQQLLLLLESGHQNSSRLDEQATKRPEEFFTAI
jgi:hypothetical protein